MKRLYADSTGGSDSMFDVIEQSDLTEALDLEAQQFSELLYSGTAENLQYIDEMIASHATGWAFERIAKVDLSILRLAAYEIIFVDSIPIGASINEAVELGKKFGGDKSAKFINGVLGAIARENPQK